MPIWNIAPGQNGPSGKPGMSGGIFIFERVKPPCIRCPEGMPGQKGRPGAPGNEKMCQNNNSNYDKKVDPGQMGRSVRMENREKMENQGKRDSQEIMAEQVGQLN